MYEVPKVSRGCRRAAIVAALVLAVAVLALVVVTNVVAHYKSAAMSALHVSAVHIVRTSAFPQNGILPFDKTIRDAAQTQRLYAALIALPEGPSGTHLCPEDLGVVYHFTFYQGAMVVATAVVKPDGCEDATLPDGSGRWAATDMSFWQVFDAVTGIPASNQIGLPPCALAPKVACAPTITPPR